MNNYDIYIDKAVESFRKLITAQLERQLSMEDGVKDGIASDEKTTVIGLVPGDGIGPVIFETARRVAEKLLETEIASGRVELRDVNGLTLENRLAKGEAVPSD
ncbi:MAG: isocitrate/isopropylmalate dehydrogenase family protein, partial [Oscillospiraceae bacterium]|nr:isocitrate/isopropylmalate dehydrogenase family protein [Oscillospiraceae bacterium]